MVVCEIRIPNLMTVEILDFMHPQKQINDADVDRSFKAAETMQL